MRLTLLDGFRGYFLLFMTIAHANVYLHTLLGKINHQYIGWVEDAQGFVFISGFVVGLVYTKRMLRRGAADMRGAVSKRMFHIWRYHAVLALGFLAAALILAQLEIPAKILAQQAKEPIAFTLAELGLLTGTLHMGILPMYIVFMAFTPLALRAFQSGQALTVAGVSLVAWLFAQSGMPDLAERPVEALLKTAGHPVHIGIYFNVFAWQVLFIGGLWFGYLMAAGKLDLGFFRRPQAEALFRVALLGFVMLAVMDIAVYTTSFGIDFSRMIWRKLDRGNLDAIYLLNFALDLYIVAWLLNAGADSRHGLTRAASAGLRRLFTWRPLVFLGQHSLQVFTAHIVLIYALSIYLDGRKPGTLEANLLLLACLPPLFLVAWVHKWAKSRPIPAAALTAE